MTAQPLESTCPIDTLLKASAYLFWLSEALVFVQVRTMYKSGFSMG